MNRKLSFVLILMLALAGGMVRAQEIDPSAPPLQYLNVCDWGLLAIEESGGPVYDITITSPANYSGVGTAFTVSGEGEGLFEGNVVIEVFDMEANLLFSGATIAAAPEIGGRGPWSIDIDLGALPEATQIVVNAYSTEPRDGEIIAHDAVVLNANSAYGLPYIEITSPLSGTDVSSLPLHVEGTAGALFENSFVIQVLDGDDNLLAETPVQYDSADVGLSGSWEAELNFTTEPDSWFVIHAFALSMADGEEIIASDVSIVTVDTMRSSFDRVMVVQVGDPISMADEMCGPMSGEFANPNISPVVVNTVSLIETRSIPPQVMLEIVGQKPSLCDMPFRVRVEKNGSAYTGQAYYDVSGDESICTRDLREFVVRVPLGTVTENGYTVEINGVSAGGR